MSDIDYSAYESVDDNDIPRIYEPGPTFEALNMRCIEFKSRAQREAVHKRQEAVPCFFRRCYGSPHPYPPPRRCRWLR